MSGLRWPRAAIAGPNPAVTVAAMSATQRTEAVTRQWSMEEPSFAANEYSGEALPGRVRRVTSSNGVYFTAPHAVAHWRETRHKIADVNTGGLALALAAELGAGAIVQAGAALRDGNWYPEAELKTHLSRELPNARVVLDLHGMRDNYGVDVCLGTGLNQAAAQPVIDVLAPAFADVGLRWGVNDPFDATPPGTLTNYCHAAGVPAVQLELARSLRTPGGGMANALIAALLSAGEALAATTLKVTAHT